jgi:hypothetical protein
MKQLREDVINYLSEERKMKTTNGIAPYWMYYFHYDEYRTIQIWFGDDDEVEPANVEIWENIEGKNHFVGHIYDVNDLKRILYLDEDGYADKTKKI